MRLLAAVVLCLWAITATADLFEDAEAAYYRGDYATALRLYRPLAEAGHADAQFSLGVMYDNGLGVPQDYVAAAKWYREAAEQDHTAAQFELAFLYGNGKGVPQDYVESHRWYNLSAAHAADEKDRYRATMYREATEAAMTSAQVAEAQKLAREWKPTPQE